MGSIHLKSSSGQTIFPLQGSGPQNTGDSSSPAGQSILLSQRYLTTSHLTVRPPGARGGGSPGGDTVLLLLVSSLALVLAGLAVTTPGLYQHLQDVLHLLPGAGSLAGPALVVPRVGLYHGGDDQSGAPLSSDLLEPSGMREREGDIKTRGVVLTVVAAVQSC